MASKPPVRLVPQRNDPSGRRPLSIVVADDDRDTTVTLASILRDEGHEVHTVLRGDEILELCRYLRPDAVIADIDMPGMSGYAVARDLHERHSGLAPLLIAVSGKWTKTSDRLVAHAVGFDHYLLKPADPRELLAILESLRGFAADDQKARP